MQISEFLVGYSCELGAVWCPLLEGSELLEIEVPSQPWGIRGHPRVGAGRRGLQRLAHPWWAEGVGWEVPSSLP